MAVALEKLERRTVVTEDRGLRTTFEGVALRDVLAQAGVVFGEKLRGKALAQVVIATARDGYQVAYAIAELDAAFTDQIVLLADRRDGRAAASRHRSVANRRPERQAAGALDAPGEQDRSEATAMTRAYSPSGPRPIDSASPTRRSSSGSTTARFAPRRPAAGIIVFPKPRSREPC